MSTPYIERSRPRLAASLKVSHSVLNSHHTVAQLMLMLGGVARQSGDPAQAREVVHKAMVLAKAAHDTPSILNGLQEMKSEDWGYVVIIIIVIVIITIIAMIGTRSAC